VVVMTDICPECGTTWNGERADVTSIDDTNTVTPVAFYCGECHHRWLVDA
jgi:hypothetical protein